MVLSKPVLRRGENHVGDPNVGKGFFKDFGEGAE